MTKSAIPLDPYGPTAARPHMTGTIPRPKTLTVDMHNHMRVPAADEFVKPYLPKEGASTGLRFMTEKGRDYYAKQQQARSHARTDIHARVAEMDRMDLDVMAVACSPPQFYYVVEPSVGHEVTQIINDTISSKIREYPTRFVGLGTVPLQDTDLAIRELDRCVKELDFRGIQIGARVGDEELSAERLEPFWTRCEELDIVVFIHPSSFATTRFSRHHLTNLIGNPLDTTTAIHYLIFDGVMARHPNLKVYLSHGGAFAAAYSARMDHAFGSRPDTREKIFELPSTYLKRFHLDTIVFSVHQLEYLVKVFGADHVALGTDYPADMAEYRPIEHVYQCDFSEADREKICGLNAAKLLKLDPAKFAR